MSRSRFWWLTALALALMALQAGRSQSQTPPVPSLLSETGQERSETRTAAKSDSTCTVYALADLDDDPDLGKWIADTIPQVIQPGTWSQGPKQQRTLTYFAPGKILVVYHSPAVQAEVAAFLRNVRKALPRQQSTAVRRSERAAMPEPTLVQARYGAPNWIQPAAAAPSSSSYPVPAPLKPPKHLFHFIIHYDGEGPADAGVTGLLKGLTGAAEEKQDAKPKADPAAAPQLRQSFNFLIRYEGEGLIDSTVAGVLKDIYGGQSGGNAGQRWSMPPVAASSCAPAGAPLSGAAPKPTAGSTRPRTSGTGTTPPVAQPAPGPANPTSY